MLAITLLLLVLGAMLAAFGVAGFLGNWTSTPDHDSIRYVQALAKSGRRAVAAGLILYAALHYGASGLTLLALIGASLAAAATYLTRTTNTIVPTGATP